MENVVYIAFAILVLNFVYIFKMVSTGKIYAKGHKKRQKVWMQALRLN